MALSDQDRTRLARLLAMFSSDYEGEVLNAARAAERLIKRAGETWETVIAPQFSRGISEDYTSRHARASPQRREATQPAHWAEVKACQELSNFLTAWEIEFLHSLESRFELSEKQRARLDLIKEKLKKYEGVTW